MQTMTEEQSKVMPIFQNIEMYLEGVAIEL
jgi:hypothetical protein